MIAAVVGCGSWGARVARRLASFEDVVVGAVFDEQMNRARAIAASVSEHTTALRDFTQYLDVMTPDVVTLAVPPGHRADYVAAVCMQYRARKQRIRIEKPLGSCEIEAQTITQMCADAGVELTVGFTLLHHPLYDAVFRLIEAIGDRVTGMVAMRCGRAPAHEADPMLDLGIHAAAVAAHLDLAPAATRIVAMHDDHVAARETRIHLASGIEIVVDELNLEARTPFGVLHAADSHDALGHDLRAWLDGEHRGTPDVALRAQRLASPHLIGAAA